MTDKRNEYMEKTQENLDVLNAKIAELEAIAKKKTGETRRDLSDRLDEIRKARQQAEQRLDELRQAAKPAWDDVKHGFEDAWHSVSKAVDSATDRFQ